MSEHLDNLKIKQNQEQINILKDIKSTLDAVAVYALEKEKEDKTEDDTEEEPVVVSVTLNII